MVVKRIFCEHRQLSYVAIAAVFGCAIGISFKMDARGIPSGQATFVALVCGVVWIIGVLVVDLVWPPRNRAFPIPGLLSCVWSGTCLLVTVVAWLCTVEIAPDPASVYLLFWRSYIQTHWSTDPVSGLSYFPLDYTRINKFEVFPRNFYLLDKG